MFNAGENTFMIFLSDRGYTIISLETIMIFTTINYDDADQ